MPTRSVAIVVFDGVQSLDLTGPLEALSLANRLRAELRRPTRLRCWRTASRAGPLLERPERSSLTA